MIKKNFLSPGIYSNPDAIVEYREILHEVLKSWVVVICCEDTEEVGEILGVSAIEMVEDKSFGEIPVSLKTLC